MLPATCARFVLGASLPGADSLTGNRQAATRSVTPTVRENRFSEGRLREELDRNLS
jgi:hypothetical protein